MLVSNAVYPATPVLLEDLDFAAALGASGLDVIPQKKKKTASKKASPTSSEF